MAANVVSGDDVGGSNGQSQAGWKGVHQSSAKESIVVECKVIANTSNVKLLHTRIESCESGLSTAAGGGKDVCARCC